MRIVALAVLAMVGMVGCAAGPPCPVYAYQPGRPFLWEVTGPRGSMVIQATHQAIDGDDVSARAWQELDRASVYVAESNEAEAGARYGEDGDWRRAFFLPPGSLSLRHQLGHDDFSALARRLDVDPAQLIGLKPWIALMLLGREAYQFPERTMNRALLEWARARRMPTEFLETWEEQVAYLDAAVSARTLAIAIRGYPAMHCNVEHRVVAFHAGDDAVFSNDVPSPAHPLVPRIERWLVLLENYLQSDRRVFAALGIGHLVGPYGVLARLAADGYQVRRL